MNGKTLIPFLSPVNTHKVILCLKAVFSRAYLSVSFWPKRNQLTLKEPSTMANHSTVWMMSRFILKLLSWRDSGTPAIAPMVSTLIRTCWNSEEIRLISHREKKKYFKKQFLQINCENNNFIILLLWSSLFFFFFFPNVNCFASVKTTGIITLHNRYFLVK